MVPITSCVIPQSFVSFFLGSFSSSRFISNVRPRHRRERHEACPVVQIKFSSHQMTLARQLSKAWL
jgi:hypothetical protein